MLLLRGFPVPAEQAVRLQAAKWEAMAWLFTCRLRKEAIVWWFGTEQGKPRKNLQVTTYFKG